MSRSLLWCTAMCLGSLDDDYLDGCFGTWVGEGMATMNKRVLARVIAQLVEGTLGHVP